MKKLGKKIIALVAVAVMGLSMVACGKQSVKDYVESKEVQEVLKTMQSQLSGSGMALELSADGDKMVYTFKYDTLEKQDGMAEELESRMSAQDSTFQSTANELKKIVKVDKPSVVIEYVDCNGEMIYSKEYIAE